LFLVLILLLLVVLLGVFLYFIVVAFVLILTLLFIITLSLSFIVIRSDFLVICQHLITGNSAAVVIVFSLDLHSLLSWD